MEQAYKICKVCGAEYPYCKTNRPEIVNRWQDVACCPEHAAQYFEEVLRARGEWVDPQPQKEIVETPKPKASRKKKTQE